MEQQLSQDDKDRFRVLDFHPIANRIGATKDAERDRADQGNSHPAHADVAGNRNILQRPDSHKAHDNMRLTKIAQAPGNGREPPNERQPFSPRQQRGINFIEGL